MSNVKKELEKASKAISEQKDSEALDILLPMRKLKLGEVFSMLGSVYHLTSNPELVSGKKASEYYLQAIELGDGLAAHNLGTLYGTGLPDFKTNQELSLKYYRQAKSMGAQFTNDSFYE